MANTLSYNPETSNSYISAYLAMEASTICSSASVALISYVLSCLSSISNVWLGSKRKNPHSAWIFPLHSPNACECLMRKNIEPSSLAISVRLLMCTFIALATLALYAIPLVHGLNTYLIPEVML